MLPYITLMSLLLATSLGSFLIYFLKKNYLEKSSFLIYGFLGGIMIVTSFFLLFLAIDKTLNLNLLNRMFIVVGGFISGLIIIYFLEFILKRLKFFSSLKKRNLKFLLAIIFHNIPEGLVVGIALGLYKNNLTNDNLILLLSLSLSVIIQNIPEGLVISSYMNSLGNSKFKSFIMGVISGVCEPIFGLLGYLVTSLFSLILPFLLALGAGCIIYITFDELISRMNKDKNKTLISFFLGFILMLLLEII